MGWKGDSMSEQIIPEALAQAPDIPPEDVLDTEAFLDELAQLSTIAYEQCRKDKATLLGIRVAVLDIEVAKRRPQPAQPDAQGAQVLFEEPQQITPETIEQTPDVTADDVLDHDAILDELAQLSPLAYDQCRQDKAKLLKVRVNTLDAEVEARRATLAQYTVPEPEAAPTLEPWTDAVDGAALLTELADTYKRYAVLPPGAPEALALWTLYTYVFDAADVNPRLQLTSPLMRCGKTRVLETLSLLASRPLPASNVSPSAIFRVIEQTAPTLLIDEADTFAKDNEELRGLLNSGHTRRTAFVLRSVPVADNQWEARKFSTWAPMALSGIGRLFPTLEDRSIRIVLKRKLPTEKVSRLPLRDDAEPFASLRRQCVRWAHDHLEAIRSTDPPEPPGLNDRAADNWRPLLAIAEVAGGDWPTRITVAIAALSAADGDNEGLGVLLLKDMQQAFTDRNGENIFSDDLVKQLHGMEERPWLEYGRERAPITKGQMARLLRPFEIRPRSVRIGADTAKGYTLEMCCDAFERYISLPDPPSENVTPSHSNNGAAKRDFQSVTTSPDVTDRKSQNPTPILTCDGVTDWNGEVAWNRASSVGTPGVPLAYSTPSGQRLPCRVCGGSERWQDGNTWRCVTCWPPAQPGRG
jgi:putative DNA primase/helicase